MGLKKGRVEALHDGIYAVAMTLLVLNLLVPKGATSVGDFFRLMQSQLPEFYAGGIAFTIVGMIWLNNYYRNAMVPRVDFTHIALDIAAAGTVVLVPFSTSVLAEYWMYPWGFIIFSWNICAAILLYLAAATHDAKYLVPKQVDQKFLRLNLAYMWFFAFMTGVFVPAIALVSPLAALIGTGVFAFVNLYSRLRLQPQFVEAHRLALAHEDDVRTA